jgi:hypothetical protein
MRRSFIFCLMIALVCVFSLPIAPVAAQPAAACTLYTIASERPFCLLVPVEDANGTPVPGAVVTVTLEQLTITATTNQTVTGPVDEGTAALSVDQLAVQPGDHLDVQVSYAGAVQRTIVGYRPDVQTRTFTMDPVRLNQVIVAPAPLYGRVYQWDTETATAVDGYTLQLYRDTPTGSPLDTFVAGERRDFTLNPGTLPNGTRLWITAQRGDLYAEFSFLWQRNPLPLQIALNWPCGGITPGGSSGKQLPGGSSGKQLPDPFCVIGTATVNGIPQPDVKISVELVTVPTQLPAESDSSPIITTTRRFSQLEIGDPMYLVDIGRLVDLNRQATTMLRFTAQRDTMVGAVELSLAELGVAERWGARAVAIELRQEHMPSAGALGGQAAFVATNGSATEFAWYVAARDGIVVRRSFRDLNWMPLLGNSATIINLPELTALAAQQLGPEGDLVVAARLDGQMAYSLDSGMTWQHQASPVGRVTALTVDPRGTIYLLGRTSLVRVNPVLPWLRSRSPLPMPPADTSTLAVAGSSLLAGGPSGVFQLADGAAAWTQVRNEAVTALAVDAQGRLLLGTSSGVLTTDLSGAAPVRLGTLADPIRAISAGTDILAVTPNGVERWNDPAGWNTLVRNDSVSASMDTPSIYEITTLGGRSFAASRNGVLLSDDNGLNWRLFNPTYTADTRSLMPTADGTVWAIGPNGLVLLTPTTINVQALPISTNLNPAVVRASNDGSIRMVGRSAGPGNHLLVAQNGGNWSSVAIGAGRGVSDIAFFPDSRGNSEAVIATAGDGLLLWQTGGGLSPFPSLPNSGGRQVAIGAVMIVNQPDCTILVGVDSITATTPAAIYTRPCDTTSAWSGPQVLVRNNAVQANTVTAIIASPLNDGRFFATTDVGYFQGQGGGWNQIFGLPIRPLALAASANYRADRTLLSGGVQSGVLRLFDATPDLQLQLTCPEQASGATTLNCTITVTNQGLLEAAAGSMTLTWTGALQPLSVNGAALPNPPNGSFTIDVPALAGGASSIFDVAWAVAADVRPSSAQITIRRALVPGEVFEANNSARTRLTLDYRAAPDPALVIGGQRMAQLNAQGSLRLFLSNPGTVAMTTTGLLRVTFPPEVAPMAPSGATLVTSRTLEWQIDPLGIAANRMLNVTYRMPPSLAEGTTLRVTAELRSDGDDREPNNNRDATQLLITPTDPAVIVLTHMPRLARRGPVEDVRTNLARYLDINGGLELALDAAPPCSAAPNGLSCAFAQYDSAIAAVEQAATASSLDKREVDRLANTALRARTTLQQAIIAYIRPLISALDVPPRYLYIIGDDDVIPYGAVADIRDVDANLNHPEAYYASSLPKDDSLYSLFYTNHYPSDRLYDQIGTSNPIRLITSRQPGGPQEISTALALYVEQGGTIVINGGTVSGAAFKLTEDGQRAVCALMREAGLPLALSATLSLDCAAIPHNVSAGATAVELGGQLIQWSDHASRVRIGDTSKVDVSKLKANALNLLLLLGCHSGLSSGTTEEGSLVGSLAQLGQPSFGYLGYAFAGTVDQEGSEAYAELLQILLVQRLLNAPSVTLADAMRQALNEYAGRSSLTDTYYNRHEKTLLGLALFGPPDYRMEVIGTSAQTLEPAVHLLSTLSSRQVSATAPLLPPSNAAPTRLPQPGDFITIAPTYRPITLAEGTYYRATINNGTTLLLADHGLPLQPAMRLDMDPSVGGALINGGSFRLIPDVDPVIQGGAPISEAQRYSERAYGGGRSDRPNWITTYTGGNGNSQLLIAGGQWSPAGNTQRLIDNLKLELTPKKAGGQAAKLGGPATNCRLNERIRVNVPNGPGVERVEVVLIEDGKFTVFPMRRVGHRWTATFYAKPWSRYFIQAVGSNGSVTLDTNGGELYIVPDEHAQCGQACDINSALDDLEVIALADGSVEIINYSVSCRYQAGLASYRVFGTSLSKQIFHDGRSRLIQPGSVQRISVNVPRCATQLDAFYGTVIEVPDPPRYADRLLVSQQYRVGEYCTP